MNYISCCLPLTLNFQKHYKRNTENLKDPVFMHVFLYMLLNYFDNSLYFYSLSKSFVLFIHISIKRCCYIFDLKLILPVFLFVRFYFHNSILLVTTMKTYITTYLSLCYYQVIILNIEKHIIRRKFLKKT